MFENEYHIAKLLAGHLSGNLNAEAEEELKAWRNKSAANQTRFDELLAKDDLISRLKVMDGIREQSIWNKTVSRIDIAGPIVHTPAARTVITRLLVKISIAASILLVCTIGLMKFLGMQEAEDDHLNAATEILPGRNGASLTFSNGRTIQLSEAKKGVVIGSGTMAYEDGNAIPGVLDGSMLTAATGKGNTYIVILPDGSKAWLNASSSLTFPSYFNGTQRTVELRGEAYFEIAKDKTHPFIVQTAGQAVEVLGTHFNINAYNLNKGIQTTLLEGSVKLSSSKNQSVLLKPDQQATFIGEIFSVKEVETQGIVAWKDGFFNFQDQSLPEIMDALARWYDIEVVYQEAITKDLFNGKISRYKKLSQVLKMLEGTGLVHFEVTGRRVIVKE